MAACTVEAFRSKLYAPTISSGIDDDAGDGDEFHSSDDDFAPPKCLRMTPSTYGTCGTTPTQLQEAEERENPYKNGQVEG
jgi:hypothetical protein